MKNKGVLGIAIICLFIFVGISSYLWYLYFYEYENKLIDASPAMKFIKGVELINSGNINYVNANTTDDESIVPIYYFTVKNHSNKDYNYVIFIEDTPGNDGCTPSTRLKRNELEYELTLDNKIIKQGNLDSLNNNVLDKNIVKIDGTNDYSLKIKLKESDTNYENKHFHYVINMKEHE